MRVSESLLRRIWIFLPCGKGQNHDNLGKLTLNLGKTCSYTETKLSADRIIHVALPWLNLVSVVLAYST